MKKKGKGSGNGNRKGKGKGKGSGKRKGMGKEKEGMEKGKGKERKREEKEFKRATGKIEGKYKERVNVILEVTRQVEDATIKVTFNKEPATRGPGGPMTKKRMS